MTFDLLIYRHLACCFIVTLYNFVGYRHR